HAADLLWRATGDPGHVVGSPRNRRIAARRVVHAPGDEPSRANVPHRVAGQRVREMAEGDGGDRRMLAQRGLERLDERRALWSGPELLVIALNQLQTWCELPRELGEEFDLIVGPRERGIGAGLTVVVTQVLITREEPDPVAADRSAQVCREITISD